MFRWFQLESIQAVFDYFNGGGTGNPVIALPTGVGKSYVLAGLCKRILYEFPTQRIIVLTHVKELIEQNSQKLELVWPGAPYGIYSAGLNQRDFAAPIIFGGIGSVNGNEHLFGPRDIIMIDECHLLSPKDGTMYQDTIAAFKKVNPFVKVIGTTATPYRLGQGMITQGGIFTDIIYDMTSKDGFNRLVAEGYLVPPIPRPTETKIDLTDVAITGGDYNLRQLETQTEKVLYAALKETVRYGYDRKQWGVFTCGIESAELAAEMLTSLGVPTTFVHSKLKESERDKRIKAIRNCEYRAFAVNNTLTTGFDHPPLDLIAMLRATISPGLWVQILGRGTRPYFDEYHTKRNCLVLDFAGNAPRLGPINDVVKPKRKGAKTGDSPIKLCPMCGCYNHAAVHFCDMCGYEFPPNVNFSDAAGDIALVADAAYTVEWLDVRMMSYQKHFKAGSPPSLKVQYFCGIQRFTQWICCEHTPGLPKHKANDWWRKAAWADSEPPNYVDEALHRKDELRIPKRVRVWLDKKPHAEILNHEY